MQNSKWKKGRMQNMLTSNEGKRSRKGKNELTLNAEGLCVSVTTGSLLLSFFSFFLLLPSSFSVTAAPPLLSFFPSSLSFPLVSAAAVPLSFFSFLLLPPSCLGCSSLAPPSVSSFLLSTRFRRRAAVSFYSKELLPLPHLLYILPFRYYSCSTFLSFEHLSSLEALTCGLSKLPKTDSSPSLCNRT